MIFKQVQEIIEGTKTQTRRIVKDGERVNCNADGSIITQVNTPSGRKKWRVGQEYGVVPGRAKPQVFYRYVADELQLAHTSIGYGLHGKKTWLDFAKHTSIHGDGFMPAIDKQGNPIIRPLRTWQDVLIEYGDFKPLSIRLTNIRQENLHDLTEADAIAEGVKSIFSIQRQETMLWDYYHNSWTNRGAVHSYRSLWESINGKGSWELCPKVWVLEFEAVQS